MPYKFELNKSFWSLNFREEYWKIFYKFKEEVLSLPSYSKYLKAQEDYNEAVKNYKIQHSPFKYSFIIFCLFFSWLGLIFLWFKNFNYYKKLKANKLALLKKIEDTKEVCLIASEKYAKEIDVSDFIKDVYDLLKYEEIGPINQYLYHSIMENNGLDLACSDIINPYHSSWGIWDKNKIVFDMSMQEIVTTMRTYTGSTVVSNLRHDANQITTLIATYEYPFSDVIIYPNRYFAYMNACDRLNFKFNAKKNLKSLTSKESKLENEEFNRVFNFDYNDEIQYRMIFTPHKQEIMINEYQLNKNKIAPEEELNKSGPYLYTNYSSENNLETLLSDANKLLLEFVNNADFDIFKYLDKLKNVINYKLEDMFKALKHLFTTPIMYSENHRTMINNALNNHDYEYYLPHYILNKIIKEEIIHYDSPCFNEIKDIKTINLNKGELLYCCVMNGLSYMHEKRVINLPPDPPNTGLGHYLIEVNYIETIPYYDQMTFYYAPLKNTHPRSIDSTIDDILSKLTNTNKNNLNEIISEANSKNIIFYLKENFIVAKVDNNKNYDEDEIKTYFQNIIKILKRK